ncbi:MAG TPA: glycogen debranching N-terminal domain-containing protein, partial [Thermosynechococcaceae cyanobacterium]
MTIETLELIELDGRTFAPADQLPAIEWPPCVLSERPHTTLTLKDDDLFLLTDTLGNIGGCMENDRSSSMGLFCCDTRFLSRLELQIEGRSPILLSSTADKGFFLTVLCANPQIDDRIRAESIGIKRELVLNGGLFEEIEVSNYTTNTVSFEISLSFDADFKDLFDIRGYGRENHGQLLRLLPSDFSASDPSDPSVLDDLLKSTTKPSELTLAYKGLDSSLMESRIYFVHQPPDVVKGFTAIWQLTIDSHETLKLGYRLQMFNNNKAISVVSAPVTLSQAKAAELMEEQTWQQQVTRIRSDKNTFNQIIEPAEQDIYLLRQSFGKGKALSAGVPWFSTLFGRDSIIAASQVLMLDPQIARETLIILAQYQGKQ